MNEILQSDDELERCGLEMADGSLIEIRNIAEDPVSTFEMDPEAVLPLIKTGQVVSTWHTHPKGDPTLSGEDYAFFASWPELKHKIIGVRDGENLTLEYFVKDGLVVCG